jgi:hypothetical protein
MGYNTRTNSWNDNIYECDDCEVWTMYETYMINHVRSHSDEKPVSKAAPSEYDIADLARRMETAGSEIRELTAKTDAALALLNNDRETIRRDTMTAVANMLTVADETRAAKLVRNMRDGI